MIKWQVMFKNVILCDWVTSDVQNKHSLIGIYSNHLAVPEFPIAIRLSLYLEVGDVRTEPHGFDLIFKFGGQEVARGRADINGMPDGDIGIIVINGFELLFPAEGTLEIDAIRDEITHKVVYKEVQLAQPL